jgi:hypothetical protein
MLSRTLLPLQRWPLQRSPLLQRAALSLLLPSSSSSSASLCSLSTVPGRCSGLLLRQRPSGSCSSAALACSSRQLSSQAPPPPPPPHPFPREPAAGSGSSGSSSSSSSSGSGPLAFLRARKAELSMLFKSYGYFTVATYFSVYLVTLGGIYSCVKLGAIGELPDVNSWINSNFIKQAVLGQQRLEVPPWGLQFAAAWVLTKTTEPVRLLFTLAAVPVLVRRLPPRVLALFGAKPPPPGGSV